MTIFYFLIAIIILVGVHEFGHYLAARLCSVHVIKFSIGFGPPIWKSSPKTVNATQWVLAAIPLGGYIKMLDGRDPEQTITALNAPMAFDRQALWKRSLIVAAGPLANFLLAFLLLTGIYLFGVNQIKPVLAEPPVESLAYQLGIEAGDEVITWDTEVSDNQKPSLSATESQILSWNRLRWKLLKATLLESPVYVGLRSAKDGSKYSVLISHDKLKQIDLNKDIYSQLGFIPRLKDDGVVFEMRLTIPLATYLAAERVWDISAISLLNIADLLTGKASLKQISGPISIADMAGKSAKVGFQPFLGFLALISISLGLLNLLPFPLLDGGQLMYDLWELISGKKVPLEVQGFLQRIGVMGLLTLTLYAIFNDISRVFHG
jgi:regulator of sigma E protease